MDCYGCIIRYYRKIIRKVAITRWRISIRKGHFHGIGRSRRAVHIMGPSHQRSGLRPFRLQRIQSFFETHACSHETLRDIIIIVKQIIINRSETFDCGVVTTVIDSSLRVMALWTHLRFLFFYFAFTLENIKRWFMGIKKHLDLFRLILHRDKRILPSPFSLSLSPSFIGILHRVLVDKSRSQLGNTTHGTHELNQVATFITCEWL